MGSFWQRLGLQSKVAKNKVTLSFDDQLAATTDFVSPGMCLRKRLESYLHPLSHGLTGYQGNLSTRALVLASLLRTRRAMQ